MRLIDADAFKEWLMKNSINDREEEESRQIGIWIDSFPSAEPRKKGKWIKKEPTIKELHGCYYECSRCHKFSLPFQKLNFCPNCGADMREGEEE